MTEKSAAKDQHLICLSHMNLSLYTDLMQCKITWCHLTSSYVSKPPVNFHSHYCCEIHYVIYGCKVFSFPEQESAAVHAGEYILIPAKCNHMVKYDTSTNCSAFIIGFVSTSNLYPIEGFLQEYAHQLNKVGSNPYVTSIIETLARQIYEGNTPPRASIAYLVNTAIFEIIKDASTQCGFPMFSSLSAASKDSDSRIRAMDSYIQDHIFDNITPEQVASHINLQVRQADRICKKQKGCTINVWIRDKRLHCIKSILATTDYSLSQIADIAGFANEYSFIRHFHKYTGITPGAYRKQSRML